MRFVIFCHSLRSDWNHGNAHFLRGVVTELLARGHDVRVFEPEDGWSAQNLVNDHGAAALDAYCQAYPGLGSILYDPSTLRLDEVLRGADVVLVHEWSAPELVAAIGRQRARGGRFTLLFHDTHHRAVTDRAAMAAFDLSAYDGVLAFGDILRRIYLERGWAKRAFTWHEAADTRVFQPRSGKAVEGDLVWIGNWGDEERTAELHEFLIDPVKRLGLKARVYGVRYPSHALAALADAGIEYGGYLPNFQVPKVFPRFKLTVHVPRRAYATQLPGIPTIRPFEALACGIPLISAPWDDAEGLFTPGEDFLVAKDGDEMKQLMRRLLEEPAFGAAIAERGWRAIAGRHTCAHRTDELLAICHELEGTRREGAVEGEARS
ncbi:CgeB family protein [Polyangium aurulentum]|uniref:CgeB family protein n=1 Tax=Polyangium aurulentum TaxID=2567896 RepID=UPI0010AEB9E7|nr:glycosyltransferase [Polyangium aurulentum]UQA59416.1 glycosyltransferase [Polyangium aurulentum]